MCALCVCHPPDARCESCTGLRSLILCLVRRMEITRRFWPMVAASLCVLLCSLLTTIAGPPIEGSISYVLDTGQPFVRRPLDEKHAAWKERILPKLGFYNRVYTFAPTDLPVLKNGRPLTGSVHQCVAMDRSSFTWRTATPASTSRQTTSFGLAAAAAPFTLQRTVPRSSASTHFWPDVCPVQV